MAAAGVNPHYVYMAIVGAAAPIAQASTSGYAWGDFAGIVRLLLLLMTFSLLLERLPLETVTRIA